MKEYQEDLQVIIDQLKAYSDKHNVDIKKAVNYPPLKKWGLPAS